MMSAAKRPKLAESPLDESAATDRPATPSAVNTEQVNPLNDGRPQAEESLPDQMPACVPNADQPNPMEPELNTDSATNADPLELTAHEETLLRDVILNGGQIFPSVAENEIGAKAIVWYQSEHDIVVFTRRQIHEASNMFCRTLLEIEPDSLRKSFVGLATRNQPIGIALMFGALKAKRPFVHLANDHKLLPDIDAFDIRLLVSITHFHSDTLADRQFVLLRSVRVLNHMLYFYLRELPDRGLMAERWRGRASPMFGIRTSGSTSAPKSLAVPFTCFAPNIVDLEPIYGLRSTDRVYVGAPATFDPFIVDVLLTLRVGAVVVLATRTLKMSPGPLAKVLFHAHKRFPCTVLSLTSSALLNFGEGLLFSRIFGPSLRLLVLGGEPAPSPATFNGLLDGTGRSLQLLFLYGLTEISCWSMFCRLTVPGDAYALYPLGAMLPSGGRAEWTITDASSRQPMPLSNGLIGELTLIDPDRRTYALDANGGPLPDGDRPHAFATGDLVEYRAEPDQPPLLLYLSRLDGAFKHFGQFVPLDAIMATIEYVRLARDDNLNEIIGAPYFAVSTQRTDGREDGSRKHLLMFVRIQPSAEPSVVRYKILRALRRHVPAHQVPLHVLCSHQWPLGGNGKFDWRSAWARSCRLEREVRNGESLSDTFYALVGERLTIDVPKQPDDAWKQKSFVEHGGKSMEAMLLCFEIEELLGNGRDGGDGRLLAALLDERKSLADVAEQIERAERRLMDPPDPRRRPIEARWTYTAGKCVDATPVVVRYDGAGQPLREFVLIGSHAKEVLTLDALTGALQARTVLSGRVEGAVRRIGGERSSRAAVGCGAGRLTVFDFVTGRVAFAVQLGSHIKSRPLWLRCCDTLVVGVYGQGAPDDRSSESPGQAEPADEAADNAERSPCNLFGVDAADGSLRWRRSFGTRSISANVLRVPMSGGHQDIVVCTLGGECGRMRGRDGRSVWSVQLREAIFARPTLDTGERRTASVLVSTLRTLRSLQLSDGQVLWTFDVCGQLFSSVALHGNRVLFGCNLGILYGVCAVTGKRLWCKELETNALTTPLVLRGQDSEAMVVCQTGGQLDVRSIVDGERRPNEIGWLVDGELYSSPVQLSDGSVVFGCRDDKVYCVAVP